MAKFGSYLFGNMLTSVIAGAATFICCVLFDVTYAVLLGVAVAALDLFPYGSTVGGFVVAAVALSIYLACHLNWQCPDCRGVKPKGLVAQTL